MLCWRSLGISFPRRKLHEEHEVFFNAEGEERNKEDMYTVLKEVVEEVGMSCIIAQESERLVRQFCQFCEPAMS